MKVLILAAGKGTRLRPITNSIPKALVEVEGETLLNRVIHKVISHGATEIVVNVSYLGNQIIDYLNSYNYPVPIKISDEREFLLDTGGAIKKALPLFTSTNLPIMIHNVDILSNVNLFDIYQQFAINHQALLVVSKRETQRYLIFDGQSRLRGWLNTTTNEMKGLDENVDVKKMHAYAFSGIHFISPSLVLNDTKFGEKFSIIDFYLEKCKDNDIFGYLDSRLSLLDIGKLSTLHNADSFIKENNL